MSICFFNLMNKKYYRRIYFFIRQKLQFSTQIFYIPTFTIPLEKRFKCMIKFICNPKK